MSEPSIRVLGEPDLPAVTEVHLAAFPESLLSRLGADVVARYYAWQMSAANDTSTVGAFADAEIMGFALGGIFRDSLNGFFRANRPLIAAAVLRRPWLVVDGLFWDRLRMTLGSLTRERQRKRSAQARLEAGQPEEPKPRRRYTVLSIGTHPDHRRKGVGRLLLDYHEERARSLGHETIWLSVNPQNAGAVAFYRSQGWTDYVEGEGWTGKMVKRV